LNGAIFIYIGTLIPWQEYTAANGLDVWRMIVLAIAVLLLRRLPAVMATYRLIPSLLTWKEAAFAGWFGPMYVFIFHFVLFFPPTSMSANNGNTTR
jgi:NhaP-type Na+/H+ or K+/H+ antiporter